MTQENLKEAMFGAGCFWGVEELFRVTPGVVETAVGYAGGTLANPTYREVCEGDTGHAEVVYMKFDPTKVSYEKLLDLFWKNHNPTSLNFQGPDYGSQYRSVIFYYGKNQKEIAEKSKEKLAQSGRFTKPIVTEITEARTFWPAEEYHQKYLLKQGRSSCHV